MSGPLSIPGTSQTAPAVLSGHRTGGGSGGNFAELLRGQLQQVSRMQSDADSSVQQLLSGQSDSLTGVFVAARKAEVAFTLLMEIRNKLVDAYQELQNMRV